MAQVRRRTGGSQDLGSRDIKSSVKEIVRETGPSLLAVLVMLSLIFGGCCSNVYALEQVVK